MLLALLVLLPIFGTFLYVGPAYPAVAFRLIVDGGTLALWLAGSCGIGVFLLRRLGASDAQSPAVLRGATAVAVGLGAISLVTLGLGLIGWLNAFTAWAMLAAGWGLGLLAMRRGGVGNGKSRLQAWLAEPAGWAWLGLLATPAMCVVLAGAMAPPGMLWTPGEPHGYDVVEYHLQVPREWFEARRIVPLHHNAFSYFPFNVEMHFLLAMHLRGGPWAGMYLAQLMHAAFMGLSVLAVYGFARAFATRAASVLAALLTLTVPWIVQLAPIAYDEGGFLLFGTLAIGWALRATFARENRLRRFALAGAMGGFAAGSKLTAVPEVLVAVPVLVRGATLLAIRFPGWRGLTDGPKGSDAAPATMLLDGDAPGGRAKRQAAGEGARRSTDGGEKAYTTGVVASNDAPLALASRARGILLFCALGGLTFAPWLVRNLAWTGNPVFPEAMPLLGRGHFTPTQVTRWERAHKPPEAERPIGARLNKFAREVITGWQFGYVLLPTALVALALNVRRPEAWFLAGLLLILIVFWLALTHLQGRFLVLAVPVAALLVAQIEWRGRIATGGAAVGVALFLTISWWNVNARLSALFYGSPEAHRPGIVFPAASDFQPLANEDVHWLTPEAIDFERFPADATLVLAGDARAFYYPLPMSRLRYRTVFDVADDAPDLVTAWAGAEGRDAGAWLLIDPRELERFSRTYWGLPPVPADVAQRDAPFMMRAGARAK